MIFVLLALAPAVMTAFAAAVMLACLPLYWARLEAPMAADDVPADTWADDLLAELDDTEVSGVRYVAHWHIVDLQTWRNETTGRAMVIRRTTPQRAVTARAMPLLL